MRTLPDLAPFASSRLRGPCLFLAGFCAVATATVATAQTFSGVGPMRSFVLPGEGPPPPAAPVTEPDTPEIERSAIGSLRTAPVAEAPLEVTRRLPVTVQGWIVEGENGTLEWPVYLTAAQSREGAKFRLAYQTDISVAPESSQVGVVVNGRLIGRTSERAAQSVRTVEFDVPSGLLRQGYNAVRIAVDQRHRVDCSIAATYELWTKVVPGRTGLVMANAVPGLVTLADLPALPVRGDGALPIRVVTEGKLQPAAVERAMRAAQAVALASRTQHPVVDFGPPSSGPDGVNLLVGLESDLARVLKELPPAQTIGPGLSFLQPTRERSATLIVSGSAERDLDSAISGLVAAGEATGSDAGIKAARMATGLPVRGGELVRLGELGLATTEFSGRRLRVNFHLNMPADFFPADYGRIEVDLAGGYGPALTRDAHIAATVNGRDAANLPLQKRNGDVFQHGLIGLPLRMLQPGINRIEITADLPRASDATCSGSDDKRFLLLDASTVRIPQLGRVGRAPELGLTAAGSLRFRRTGWRPHLIVPSPDRFSIAAAASVAARLAVVSGETIDFSFGLALPDDRRGGILIVAPARVLDPRMIERVGLSPARLRQAWQERARAAADPSITGSVDGGKSRIAVESIGCRLPPNPAKPFPQAARSPGGTPSSGRPGTSPVATPPPAAAERAADPMENWSSSVLNRPSWSLGGLLGSAVTSLDGARLRIEGFGHRLSIAFGEAPAFADVTDEDVLVVAEGETDRGDAIVLVTGPDAPTLSAGVECLTGPEMWRQLSGRVSILAGPEPGLRTVRADQVQYAATQAFSLSNWRLVASGWLSLHLGVFTAIALAIALALASSTTWLVRNVGRRQE